MEKAIGVICVEVEITLWQISGIQIMQNMKLKITTVSGYAATAHT